MGGIICAGSRRTDLSAVFETKTIVLFHVRLLSCEYSIVAVRPGFHLFVFLEVIHTQAIVSSKILIPLIIDQL